MFKHLAPFIFLATAVLAGCPSAPPPDAAAGAWAHVPKAAAPTDHGTFFAGQGPFEDGPAVTRACLECHEGEAHDFMKTQHWNWEGEEVEVPGHEQPMRIGKKNVINNFCIGVQSNWAACTTCHAGYGWTDSGFDFTDPTKVDCLVCHDHTGTYTKKGKTGGLVDPSVDLMAVAQSVGRPTRANCGACHFNGGGGNAVKHGDLDMTLAFPTERIDVHMGRHDLTCVDCHQAQDHDIPGRSMSVSVTDTNRVACTDCHDAEPHDDVRLNAHLERVACQTCHIPHMAVEEPTKMTWDWSQAGQDRPEDKHVYMKIKGEFTYGKGVAPEYRWYDGRATRYILGDELDPSRPTVIAGPLGDREEPKAKIWPFKVHRGKQPYDAKNKYFLVPNVHGPEGFWTKFDWDTALRNGSKATGLEYSGEYAFAPTEMYWPLSHMVATKDQTLQCQDCHGENGRLDWAALGYDHDPLGREALEHDPVTLMDADGEPALESGRPFSTRQTCGQCHELEDEGFAATHGYHRAIDAASLPLERRDLMRFGPRLSDGEDANCLLCHAENADLAARAAGLTAEDPAWSVAATVPGLTTSGEAGLAWNPEAFDEDGAVDLGLRRVPPSACGACHGEVDADRAPVAPAYDGSAWTTENTGQIYSGQRIRLSGLNIAGKDALRRSWDVHAERLVACGDCHYNTERPERLAGEVPQKDQVPGGERRTCESCHAVEGTHTWLAGAKMHLDKVSCESCHVPELHAPARELVDRTVVRTDGAPAIHYRGVEGDPRDSASLVTGYRPVLLTRWVRGRRKLTPYNTVTELAWVDAKGAPVDETRVRAAWLAGGGYAPEVTAAFDTDGDRALSERELRLDTPEKVALVAGRIAAQDVDSPRIAGTLRAYPIHHGVTGGESVLRACTECHDRDRDVVPDAFELAPYLPAGVTLEPVGDADQTKDAWRRTTDGRLEYAPPLLPGDRRHNRGKETR